MRTGSPITNQVECSKPQSVSVEDHPVPMNYHRLYINQYLCTEYDLHECQTLMVLHETS